MSTQIAVRLPDAQVAFLDREVSQGHARSRAELVSKALCRLERERTRARFDRARLGERLLGPAPLKSTNWLPQPTPDCPRRSHRPQLRLWSVPWSSTLAMS